MKFCKERVLRVLASCKFAQDSRLHAKMTFAFGSNNPRVRKLFKKLVASPIRESNVTKGHFLAPRISGLVLVLKKNGWDGEDSSPVESSQVPWHLSNGRTFSRNCARCLDRSCRCRNGVASVWTGPSVLVVDFHFIGFLLVVIRISDSFSVLSKMVDHWDKEVG